MKRWENGQYIELSEAEKAELAAWQAAAEAEERAVAEREAAAMAREARSGRVTLTNLVDVVSADEVYLHVPDDADEKKIEAVVKAHNPIAPSKSEKAEKTKMERRTELQTKIAKVKDEKLTLPELREIVAALAELMGVFDA